MSEQADAPRVPSSSAMAVVAGEDFDLAAAIGGWRGLIESALPGAVFVGAFIAWGGFKIPTLAAVATVTVMVAVRLVQRTPVTQALAGVVGVALGAVWAWRVGDARGYFVPGLWMTGALGAAILLSMAVRWPAVGIVVGALRGWGSAWRADPALMRRFQWASAVYVLSQAIRLAIQLPLYFAQATAALGTAKLALGLPYYVVTLWVIWWMVRRATLSSDPRPQPPQTQ